MERVLNLNTYQDKQAIYRGLKSFEIQEESKFNKTSYNEELKALEFLYGKSFPIENCIEYLRSFFCFCFVKSSSNTIRHASNEQ